MTHILWYYTFFVLRVSKVLSEGGNKIFRKKNFIGVSATKSWEKSRNFRYGSYEDFLSKGQKTEGGGDSNPLQVLIGLRISPSPHPHPPSNIEEGIKKMLSGGNQIRINEINKNLIVPPRPPLYCEKKILCMRLV